MRSFALALKGTAIGGKQFRFRKQSGSFGNNALVKLENAGERLHKIFMSRPVADRFSQCLERPEHVGKALLQHGQQQFYTSGKVHVQSALRAADLSRDLSGGDT